MTDFLDHTLQRWRASTFEHGQRDCLLSVGDYVAECGGVNVAARYKGTYTTENEALALMAAAGGAVALGDETGLSRTETPVRGDVVVIDAGIAGLCTGQGVAFRRPEGVIEINIRFVNIIGAWRCERS